MFPPEFDYRRAGSVGEAIDLLATNESAELLAGGHSLIPDMKNREADPGTVIDVSDVDSLAGIDATGGRTRIGALTTYADLVASDRLWERAPVLAEAASKLGDRQIRNRGTIGGNLAQSEPGADLPAAAIAADATIEIVGQRGEREVDAEEFFLGERETDVGEAELVKTVGVPHREAVGAYEKKTHPASGYALVGVATAVEIEGGRVTNARVAANGALDYPVRLDEVEATLEDERLDEATIEEAAECALAGVDEEAFRSDPQISGEFRANVLPVYVREALSRAVERGGERA